ncbi:MAG: hypothetical protein AAFN63_01650 [Pseudomonadota bacterium]
MTDIQSTNTAVSRRNLLLGIAAASTAVAATPAAAASDEIPELIQMADALPGLAKAYTDACEEVEWIIAEWQPQVPTPDFDLVRYGGTTRRYQTIDGRGIPVALYRNPDIKDVPSLGTAETFEASFQERMREAERKAKTPSQRGMQRALEYAENERARIEPARAYWTEFDRVKAASGIEAAQAKAKAAREALHTAVADIMAVEERTMAGVVIKAQALAEWSKVDLAFKAFNADAPKWSDQMSASIIRQAGGAAV